MEGVFPNELTLQQVREADPVPDWVPPKHSAVPRPWPSRPRLIELPGLGLGTWAWAGGRASAHPLIKGRPQSQLTSRSLRTRWTNVQVKVSRAVALRAQLWEQL